MNELQFNPLQWPPDLTLARLHYDCCRPGIDNTEGRRCPCCNRLEKLSNSKWPLRDIVKDFKNYGGGVPGYFHQLIYFMVMLIILTILNVVFHILALERVCPTLSGPQHKCMAAFGVFLLCDSTILYNQLVVLGEETQANALLGIQLATYIFLVAATLGIKVILNYLNHGHDLDGKLFSRFSLILKNVPLYYQLEDLKEQLKVIDPTIQIGEMFYLFKTCECESKFRELSDLYFLMKQTEENLKLDDREKYQKKYRKQKEQYLKLYDKYQKELQNLKASSKKVVIVFNTIDQKQRVHKVLRMNEVYKFCHYLSKIFGCNKNPIGYYSQRLAEPQQINWKYIGESSTNKLKVRIQTTILGIGLIAVAFGIFYFPMIIVDQQRILDPGVGTGLGFLISFVIFFMTVLYRLIIIRLTPSRKPSSKLAQGYFIVMTCTIFHFFFYLVSPACFYIFTTSIPKNFKLAELFMTGLTFSLLSTIMNLVDIGYRRFNSKKNRLLNKMTEANAMCQGKLHDEITPPSFPINFKMIMVFNVWIFNGFYIFNIPWLLLFFFGVYFFLYWIDKYILYNHYKMQSYLSLQLEHQIQKVFLVVFLVCVSLGYLIICQFVWQQIVVGCVFVIALVLNFTLQFFFKKKKDEILKHNSDIKTAIQHMKSNLIATQQLSMMEVELRNSFVLNDPKALNLQLSEASLNTAFIMYGYKETYHLYLSQFHANQMQTLLENKYLDIKRAISRISAQKGEKKRQSQLVELVSQSIEEKLIRKASGDKITDKKEIVPEQQAQKLYQPPQMQEKSQQNILPVEKRQMQNNSVNAQATERQRDIEVVDERKEVQQLKRQQDQQNQKKE